MTRSPLERRLRRVETARGARQRVVVVTGTSEAEHDTQIAALIAAGEAAESDLFVCILRFADPSLGAPR